jgi:3-oxoacyl-[acyl-carrier-protein] synthase III
VSGLYVHGIGHFHPENRIDNAFLASLDIGTDDEWILERVGIRERRTVLSLDYIRTTRNSDTRAAAEASRYTNAETGAFAARMALARAGLQPSDVGMVISGGCSPQNLIPAEACSTAAELGIEAPCLDVNSACSSFVAQLDLLARMRADTLPDYMLVVNQENTTRTVDYSDRNTAVLWGDGSSAAVVSARHQSRAVVTRSSLRSDPSGWSRVRIAAGGHFVQDGSAVQKFAITRSAETVATLGNGGECFRFIGHQANLGMLRAVVQRAGLLESQHLFNVDRFGNCGAAGAPSVLSENWDGLTSGDIVALVVVGSGLSWGGLRIEFQ